MLCCCNSGKRLKFTTLCIVSVMIISKKGVHLDMAGPYSDFIHLRLLFTAIIIPYKQRQAQRYCSHHEFS